MNVKKLLAYAAASAITLAGLSGCSLFDSEDDDAAAVASLNIASLSVDSNWVVSGVVTGAKDAKVTASLWLGSELAGGYKLTVSSAAFTADSGKIDSTVVKIASTGSVSCKGPYTLRVIASNATASDTLTASIAKTTGLTCGSLAAGTAYLGAQRSDSGSFLDVDAMTSYNSSSVTSVLDKIDLVFGYDSVTNNSALFASPKEASASGSFKFTSKELTFDSKMAKLKSSYDSLTTLNDLVAEWDLVKDSAKNFVKVDSTAAVIVKTSEGSYGIVKVHTSKNLTGKTAEVHVKGMK